MKKSNMTKKTNMTKKSIKKTSTHSQSSRKTHATKNTKKKHNKLHLDKHNFKLYKNQQGMRLLIMPPRNETATASIYFFFQSW